jgi:CheY-like chemotaxis protein
VALIYNPVALAERCMARQRSRALGQGGVPIVAAPRSSGQRLPSWTSAGAGGGRFDHGAPCLAALAAARGTTAWQLAKPTACRRWSDWQRGAPGLVLSDIEMPRMDGFDFVRNIRADARCAKLPVIMITSRIAEKHREHARELGVDHYLGKPYAEDELLGLIRDFTRAAASGVTA